MPWYYANSGQERQGPVTDPEFEKLVSDGLIRPDTMVWREGMAQWQAYSAVAGGAATPGAGEATEMCAVSGKRYPRREMIQYEGKWISAEHRDQFFQRLREGVGTAGQLVYAGFWQRFLAKFVDGIALYVIGIPINLLLALWLLGNWNFFTGQAAAAAGPQRALAYTAVSTLIGMVITVGYNCLFISRYQATPGKMALGLKLVRTDGSALSMGRIVGRYFAEWLSSITLCIGYLMAAFDDQKRSLHDRICDTRVIKTK